jgi:hypothetical protein
MEDRMNKTFDPQTLAEDLAEVRRIYAAFFAGLTDADWERPVKGGPKEWNLHETVAHLCALSGDGLESIEYALRGKTYKFAGLDNRYQFTAYNRHGIDAHLHHSREDLCAEFLGILDRAGAIARCLSPEQAKITAEMPIYNRPVKVIEALSIIMFHAALHHSAQVAEPAGVAPLWQQLSPELRHRITGRVMRALSLLYRYDLGGDMRKVFSFRIDGPGGGAWFVQVSPEAATSGEGTIDQSGLDIQMRETAVFCRMFTGRFNPLVSLLNGDLRLRGDFWLFPRLGSLFSIDARK